MRLPLLGHKDGITSIAVSPNNKYIVSGSYDGQIKVWNTQTDAEIKSITGKYKSVNSVAITPDSKYIISGNN